MAKQMAANQITVFLTTTRSSAPGSFAKKFVIRSVRFASVALFGMLCDLRNRLTFSFHFVSVTGAVGDFFSSSSCVNFARTF